MLSGLGSGAGRSRSRLKKNPGAGAAGKKRQKPEPLKIWPAPQPCEKIKSIRKLYFSYSFLGKILSFMVEKDNYFTCFIFFLKFYLTSLRGEDYFAKEPDPVGAGCFWPLDPEPEPLEKKYQEPEPLRKKIRSRGRSRLKKKSGAGARAGAAKKFAGSPSLIFTVVYIFPKKSYYPPPPCFSKLHFLYCKLGGNGDIFSHIRTRFCLKFSIYSVRDSKPLNTDSMKKMSRFYF